MTQDYNQWRLGISSVLAPQWLCDIADRDGIAAAEKAMQEHFIKQLDDLRKGDAPDLLAYLKRREAEAKVSFDNLVMDFKE